MSEFLFYKKKKSRKFVHKPQVYSNVHFQKNTMEKNSYKAKLATRLSTSEGEPGRNTVMKNDMHYQRQNCILGTETQF